MKTVPQVLLRDSGDEDAVEPFVKPHGARSFVTNSLSRYRIDGEIAEGGMGKILKGRDTDLGRDACQADDELTWLAKECLSGEPTDRPCDAGVLANRISEHQAAVENRLRDSEIDRAAARAEEERKRRRVSLALAASLLAFVLAVSSGFLWVQTLETAAAEKDAQSQKELAEAAEEASERMRWSLYQSDIQRAQSEIDHGNYSEAKDILTAYLPREGQRDLRNLNNYLYRKCPTPTKVIRSHFETDLLNVITGDHATSGDGSRIAAVIDSDDGESQQIAIWNARSGQKEWSTHLDVDTYQPDLQLNVDGSLVGVSTHGTYKAKTSDHTEVHIWDVNTNRRISKITSQQITQFESQVATFKFRPGSSCIAMQLSAKDSRPNANRPTSLVMWDFASGTMQFEIEQFAFAYNRPIAFSPDGALITTCLPFGMSRLGQNCSIASTIPLA